MIGVDASGQIYDEEFDLFFGMFYFINFKYSISDDGDFVNEVQYRVGVMIGVICGIVVVMGIIIGVILKMWLHE